MIEWLAQGHGMFSSLNLH